MLEIVELVGNESHLSSGVELVPRVCDKASS